MARFYKKSKTYHRPPIPASSVIAFAPRAKRAVTKKLLGPPSIGSDINKIANRMHINKIHFR